MAEAVLISIRPEWAEKILFGKKTQEVRKHHASRAGRPAGTLLAPRSYRQHPAAGDQHFRRSRGLVRPQITYTTFDSDAIDISVPSGCTALSDPVQLPGYGGYKTIIYIENM